jgi:hypothetical protein
MVCQPKVESREPSLHAPVLRPRQPDIQAGCGEFTEFQDAFPVAVGHPQDVADDCDRELCAIPADNVDDTWLAGELIQQDSRGLFDAVP